MKIIGNSPAIHRIREEVATVADLDLPVAIHGPSGSGKELVARALHNRSRQGAFVPVNCAAIPETLMEAEFFGHVAGAFTGAPKDRVGFLEAAHEGTLFLDEVGELPPTFQPKLLRALDTGEFMRLGETRVRKARFRLVTATHRNLREEVREGRFREDLFWRLQGIVVRVPALAERKEDIEKLVTHFVGEDRLTPAALKVLLEHSWPGNVRELRSVLLAADARSGGAQLRPSHFADSLICVGRNLAYSIQDMPPPTACVASVEKWHILRALTFFQGNRSRAAESLGIDPKTLWRKCKMYSKQSECPRNDWGPENLDLDANSRI